MDLVPNDKAKGLKTPVWDEYKKLLNDAEGKEVKLEGGKGTVVNFPWNWMCS